MTTLPTPYPDLNTVLHGLTDGVRSALDTATVGIYLQGSFAIGDFDRHSDVDFVVVVEGDLTELQVEALQRLHARVYALDCPWAQHLEGSYFPRAAFRDLSHCGEPLWYLEHGSRSLSRDAHCNTLVVRWTVRAYGVTLLGPVPVTLIDPIPVDDLRDEMRAEIHDWGRAILAEPDRFRNRFYQSFIVLTYCRMLRDLQAGDTGSKRVGAEWARINLDPRWGGLIDRAWGGRPDPARSIQQAPDPDDFQLTLEFVAHCIDLSSRLQLDGSP